MTIKRRPLTADGTSAERRKGPRFPVAVPVEVSWRGKDGIAVKEEAVARQVSANGGVLKMSNYPVLGSRVTLANFLSAQDGGGESTGRPRLTPRGCERHRRRADCSKRELLGCGFAGQ